MDADLLTNALGRARERAMTTMELLTLIGQFTASNNIQAVKDLYREWLAHNADNATAHAMYFNYAVVLSNSGDQQGAKTALLEALRINPNFMPAYINLGGLLERMGAIGEGVQQWYEVANRLRDITGEATGYKTAALKQIGRVLERVMYDENAEDALRLSLDLNPNQLDVIQHWLSLRQRQCKWPVVVPVASLKKPELLAGISALSLAAHTDDPFLLLGNAAVYSKVNVGRPPKLFSHTHQDLLKGPQSQRRRIGYVSSDLREHAIGFLTAELYEVHDRSKVEVFLYYCGHEVTDEVHARIKAAGDHWIDFAGLSDEAAAERIVADKIEILVDVNGYTHSARAKVFAMRPAPIIVNWLGFPGSLGSPSHHYIVADEFVIPKTHELYYTEKVLRLPCYQPNDRKRVISAHRPTRSEAGLPDGVTVYCCFNGAHKITPFVWKRWMDILKQVPDSVLWLLSSITSTDNRLKKLAVEHGIAPERIIFAPKIRNPDHLARYPLADLFLDTSPYGAHTTSSDALWMGVPVLTLVGRSFAARVCGSLVHSAGLDELLCYTPTAFVTLAIELGRNKAKLAGIRQKLTTQRDSCVLFDTPLLAASFEKLYAEMWDDFRSGRLPRPDMANLDVYLDIGIELDANDVEILTVPDFQGLYLEKLADRDSFSALPRDTRLWDGRPVVKRPALAPPQPAASPKPDTATLLNSATLAFQNGNYARGDELLNGCLVLDPKNAIALDLAARVALIKGELVPAEAFARRAIQERPLIPFGLTLAEIIKAKGDLQGAATFFISVLTTQPKDVRALSGLADVYEQSGYRAKAIECYQRILTIEPANMAHAIKFSNLLSIPELSRGLAALDTARPATDGPVLPRLSFLNHVVPYKEWAERAARGHMPYHVTSLDEMFFTHASQDRDAYEALADLILTHNPLQYEALGAKAVCRLSRQDYAAAETYFQKIAETQPGSIYETITFQSDYFSRLEKFTDADLVKNLPPVIDVASAVFGDSPIIYLSCNFDYFADFTRPMLASIDACAAAAQAHLHIMDASEDNLAVVKSFCAGLKNVKVAISAEQSGVAARGLGEARAYYHAVRFIRLYQHLQSYAKPLWLMDVDALLNQNPQSMFAAIGKADVAFRARPGRWEPWNQFNASVAAFRPTKRGLAYLHLIAAYIADFHGRNMLRWGIDQLAMYSAHVYLSANRRAPKVHLLNDHDVDYEYYDDGVVWCNSGKDKFSQMKKLGSGEDTQADPHKAKYLKKLTKFVTSP